MTRKKVSLPPICEKCGKRHPKGPCTKPEKPSFYQEYKTVIWICVAVAIAGILFVVFG